MPDLITAKYVKTQIEHPQLHHPGMALPFVFIITVEFK